MIAGLLKRIQSKMCFMERCIIFLLLIGVTLVFVWRHSSTYCLPTNQINQIINQCNVNNKCHLNVALGFCFTCFCICVSVVIVAFSPHPFTSLFSPSNSSFLSVSHPLLLLPLVMPSCAYISPPPTNLSSVSFSFCSFSPVFSSLLPQPHRFCPSTSPPSSSMCPPIFSLPSPLSSGSLSSIPSSLPNGFPPPPPLYTLCVSLCLSPVPLSLSLSVDHHIPWGGVCVGGQLPEDQMEGDQPQWERSHGPLGVFHRPPSQPGGHRHRLQVL